MKTEKPEKIEQLTCKRCGHTWYPKLPTKPKSCARCKSYDWDKDRVNHEREKD